MTISWVGCCAARQAEDDCSNDSCWINPLRACSSPHRLSAASGLSELAVAKQASDEVYHDCFDNEAELISALSSFRCQAVSSRTDCCTVDGCAAAATAAAAYGVDCCGEFYEELASAAAVLEQTREEWTKRVIDLRDDALAELQWADFRQAQRMLKANIGDVQKSVQMFLQALEFRARDRELFETLKCEVCCDMRIIGRDIQEHPVLYMCARSQTEPIGLLRDQLILAFEQACRLSQNKEGDGRVVFLADMYGLQPHLNMDMTAFQDLASMFGTVFAERIFKIVIVDFSRAAQAAWWMAKQFVSPVTREKLAFVGEAKALEICRKDFDDQTFDRVQKSFLINREGEASPSDRLLHAKRTAIGEIPLGPLREEPGQIAGKTEK